jgi:hypothetical protein
MRKLNLLFIAAALAAFSFISCDRLDDPFTGIPQAEQDSGSPNSFTHADYAAYAEHWYEYLQLHGPTQYDASGHWTPPTLDFGSDAERMSKIGGWCESLSLIDFMSCQSIQPGEINATMNGILALSSDIEIRTAVLKGYLGYDQSGALEMVSWNKFN